MRKFQSKPSYYVIRMAVSLNNSSHKQKSNKYK